MTCFQGSIVPRLNLSMIANMSKAGRETDKLKNLIFNWMPIYIAFLDDLEAEDSLTSTQIEDILELQHDVTNEDTYPLFSGTDLVVGDALDMSNVNDSNEAFGDYGLTTALTYESVAFDKLAFWANMRYKTNKGKLAKVCGQMRTVMIGHDTPYRYTSNNFTYPTVKRMNPYTFCGILIHLPYAGDGDQVFNANDVTSISHLSIQMQWNFSEWNQNFDQTR